MAIPSYRDALWLRGKLRALTENGSAAEVARCVAASARMARYQICDILPLTEKYHQEKQMLYWSRTLLQ